MATAAQPSVGCFVTPGDLWQQRGGSHASVAAGATDATDATDAEACGGLEHFGPSNLELSSLLLVRLVAAPNGLTRVHAYGLGRAGTPACVRRPSG